MERRNTEEIAREIVAAIKDKNPAAKVSAADVHVTIERWRKPDFLADYGSRRHNADYAADVIKWIEDGQKLLAGRPDVIFPAFLFRQSKSEPNWADLLSTSSMHERIQSMKDLLADMRQQCELIIDNKVGTHGNSRKQQERAAWAAVDLMEQYELPRAYSSENSAYRKVARLIFEEISGEAPENGADIYRACKAAALERAEELAWELSWADLH